MMDPRRFVDNVEGIRRRSPLVLNLTNYVAMNFAANALNAIGASPLMSFCREEMEDLVRSSDALVINIGCLDRFQVEAMVLAATTANLRGLPWVLDPVGVGASRYRMEACRLLIGTFHPAVIRANASEIAFLADGRGVLSHGVDSLATGLEVLDAARSLALQTGAVVSMSGAVDYVTDGVRTETIANGHRLMPRVSAMGCTASSLTGAFLALEMDRMEASLGAMAMMGCAGERASVGLEEQPGTFAARFLDCLGGFDAECESRRIRQMEIR